MPNLPITHQATIIGAGPAGLMAAEQLSNAGYTVNVYDAKPSVGRKFLRAGIGGLNLTHAEPQEQFVSRFGKQAAIVGDWLAVFAADDLRQWAEQLGVKTFEGSSGRVFPTEMKAAPLLRAWLRRLRSNNVRIHTRHRWLGWAADGSLQFQELAQTPASTPKTLAVNSAVTIFALGGGSWASLGSDGQWLNPFQAEGISCLPFQASNMGFDAEWRADFREQHQGKALKSVGLKVRDGDGQMLSQRGDAMISQHGIEGGLVYSLSAAIREQIKQQGSAEIYWDLLPDRSVEQLQAALNKKRPKDSMSSLLRRQFKLDKTKQALLNQLTTKEQIRDLAGLPQLLKHLPQTLSRCRPIDEAISTAGGVDFADLSPELMLKNKPAVFCIGEMLDWEAPTGGYLLTACFASGVVAGRAAVALLDQAAKP